MEPQRDPSPDAGRPLPRIGDAERDRAVGFLQEHMAQGRLDQDEFEDRLNQALRARTEADLSPLFDDLPEPRPATGLARIETPQRPTAPTAAAPPAETPAEAESETYTPRWASITLAAIWPVAILINVLFGFDNWWAWVVGGILTWFIRQNFTNRPKPPDAPPALGR